MAPTALTGDRLPALAPLVTASAVRNGGIFARRPRAMAIGATSATLGDRRPVPPSRRRRRSRTAAREGRGRRRARGAGPARRLLPACRCVSASANSSVTPARVTNSAPGKARTDEVVAAAAGQAGEPGQGEREQAHVHARGAAEDDGEEERQQRQHGGAQQRQRSPRSLRGASYATFGADGRKHLISAAHDASARATACSASPR